MEITNASALAFRRGVVVWLRGLQGLVAGCVAFDAAELDANEFPIGFTEFGEWGAGIAGADPEVPTLFSARVNAFCIYRPRIDGPARATVAIFRVSETGSSSRQRYEVHHAGHVTSVDVPFAGTSDWVTLGTFDFSGGGAEHVRLVKAFATPIRTAEVRFTWFAPDGRTPIRTDVITTIPAEPKRTGTLPAAHAIASDELAKSAALALPPHLSDGVVFQRGAPVLLSGRAPEQATVSASLHGLRASTVSRDGTFKLELPALPAGGPYELCIACGVEERVVRDVWIGELWICAGQSNMAMTVSGLTDREDVLADAEYPSIRYFKQSGGEQPDPGLPPRWVRANRKDAAAFTAVGFTFARALHRELKVAVGLMYAWRNGGDIRLFIRDAALADLAPRIPFTPGSRPRPTLFSDFLAPLVGMPVAGLLYYQGEGNQKDPLCYRELLPAMVRDIRDLWGRGDFAFINVQLPRYRGGFVGVREAQFLAQRVIPNSALVVSIDAGVPDLLHPGDKRIIGERAARAALGLVYARPGVYTGPMFSEARIVDGGVEARFEHTGTGLEARGDLEGFEVRGDAGGFMPAKAEIIGLNAIRVWRADVGQPAAVRYLWSGSPRASLYNREGFPASPFRTDIEGAVVVFDNAEPDVATRGKWERQSRAGAFGVDVLEAVDERDTLGDSDWHPWVKWRFEVRRSGVYAVDVWWPEGRPETARAGLELTIAGQTHAPIEIVQAGSAGRWFRLGEFLLHYGNGDHLKLQALGPGVVADAVRISFLHE